MRGKYLSGGALSHYKWLRGKVYSTVIPTRRRGHWCQVQLLQARGFSYIGYSKYAEILSICSLKHYYSSCKNLNSFHLPYGSFIFQFLVWIKLKKALYWNMVLGSSMGESWWFSGHLYHGIGGKEINFTFLGYYIVRNLPVWVMHVWKSSCFGFIQ